MKQYERMPNTVWTSSMDQVVVDNYQTLGCKRIAEFLDLPVPAVKRRAKKLGVIGTERGVSPGQKRHEKKPAPAPKPEVSHWLKTSWT